jgi:glucokinase
MMILSGDIGGTNIRLVLIEVVNNKQKVIEKKSYKCIDFQNVADIIRHFLKDVNQDLTRIDGACFAIAGPIINDQVKFTNLPWSIDLKQLKHELKQEKIALVNDFQAIGYGITTLNHEDLHSLQEGKPEKHGIKAIIGAGTGLGVSFMYWNGTEYVVSPTEGGHMNFAPDDDMQMEILHFLRKKYHRVSNERLLSGPGIVNIYSYFLSLDTIDKLENPDLRFAMHKEDPAKAITEYAIQHQDPLALQTVDAFINIYGSCAGNLAYTFLPKGGLFIAGGIAIKLIKQITDGRFMRAFSDKGRLSPILSDIPVNVILNSDVGLYGAALLATRL